MEKNLIINAYKSRHACKIFDKEKLISPSDFDFIIETGRLSPSSFGFEPWKFLIVQDTKLREELIPYTWGGQNQVPTCSHLILTLARKSFFMKHDSEYISNFMQNVQKLPKEVIEIKSGFYKKFQEQDFNLLESERNLFDWACKQTYIALGNMMTSAALIGIDSCPMEGFDKNEIDTVLQNSFEIDTKKFGISHMVAFGYRLNVPQEKTRQSVGEVTEWFK